MKNDIDSLLNSIFSNGKLNFNNVNISLCLEVVEAEFEPGSHPPASPDSNRTSCLS